MKKQLLLFCILQLLGIKIIAQLGISATNTPPNASAMLDVSSNTKGILIPRMTTLQKNAISNKAEGLMVYDTDLKLFSYWVGSGPIGYWTDFPQPGNNNPFPTSGILLSETLNNIVLINSGFAINGITSLTTSPYQPGSFLWYKPLALLNASLPRDSHSAVWTGTEMIIWGGYENNVNPSNQGKIYNPASDTWRSMAIPNLVERSGHVAFWTGSKMLVWGGDLYVDGAAFDPNLDQWTNISNTNAPSIRDFFSAVLAGSKMIIWGGTVFNSTTPFLNDGKIYDINIDSWANMNNTNAPAGRQKHTAVWTGSKMIIFGGQLGSKSSPSTTNTGAIYDLNTNSWVPTSTIGAPFVQNHKAIWTGSKMIIWGGDGPSGNQPFIYDPATDSWTSGTNVNAPIMRKNHTIIWTGTKMIVFGGNNFNNDGGIYDPVSNVWTVLNPLSGDTYIGHSAIWTGEDMIVFGPSPGYILKKDFGPPTIKQYYLYKKN